VRVVAWAVAARVLPVSVFIVSNPLGSLTSTSVPNRAAPGLRLAHPVWRVRADDDIA